MRGIAWLGRRSRVSTAVSPLAFRNARSAPLSRATRQYFGLGQNQPAAGDPLALSARTRAAQGPDGGQCLWGLGEWDRPIAATELVNASQIMGSQTSALLTGAAFSDDAVRARADLGDYRILHFATHGFVTAPRPECAARPALLTSYGPGESDGLLSFEEIFDLRIDADLVILSACDTAGAATVAATRAAGVTTGGGTSLDGLVRAFIGAGGRSVMASHWPVPDDFNATQRLIGGLFSAPEGTRIADALGSAQRALMDETLTSHPYYWAGFAIVGDGKQMMVPPAEKVAQARSAEAPRALP
jgi:CHAT domain-containing protein